MPQIQAVTTYLALNACNDTSPSGVTDRTTGQTIYLPDLDLGVYFDVTNREALLNQYATNGNLYAGRYRRVLVDSGATAANVKTGTIGLMPSLAAIQVDGGGVSLPTENIVTSYDQALGTGLRPVVFLNAITPGNYGFVQELGIATVLGKASLTATATIGDVIIFGASGLVDDPTQSTSLTYALWKQILGQAIDLPKANGLFRVQLQNWPVVQE